MESMDTPKKLNEWLIKMGYEGKIPSNLKPFCNPCTVLIWEQLIQIVKSKEEIAHIRNNILINRLLRNDETCLNSSISFLKCDKKSVLREIEVWYKKKTLEKQLSVVRDDICENKAKLNNVVNNNKIKYMNLESCKQKVVENQQVMFLLNKKSEKLKSEINDVEEMLTLARNLTPVENEEQNKTEVLETLRMCSEKLEKIIEKQNESQPVSRVNTEGILEQKTPHNKIFKSRRAFSSQKKSVIFSSTKIINQTKIKSKQDHNDSLGLLDDFSITFDSTLPASSFKDTNFSNINMCYDIAILNDTKLNSLVEESLYKNDRYVLWNVLFELNKNSKTQLIDCIVDNDKKTSSVANMGSVDKNKIFMKLYAMHVEHELKTRKTRLNIKQLQKQVHKMEEETFTTLRSMNALSQVIDYLKLQQKEAGLIKGIEYIHKTINIMQKSNEKQTSLEIFKDKASHLDENIFAKISSIEHKYNVFKQVYDLITQSRNETCLLARKLGQFTLDFNWTSPLNSNLSSMEIETFLEFPIEYNRKVAMGDKRIFFHDLPINYILYQDDLDSNALHMLVTLLQNPCSPAETLLMDIIRTKIKMDYYKSLRCISEDFETNRYTLEELRNQEAYVSYALEKLQSLTHAASSHEAMNILKNVKEAMHLWIEMPIKSFISTKRLFKGHSYSHYEKLYENFYRQL